MLYEVITGIAFQRDVFRHYRCDSASAIEAGNDIRTALITFGIDASHGVITSYSIHYTKLYDIVATARQQ